MNKGQLYEETKKLFKELNTLLTEDYLVLIVEKGSEKILHIIFSFSLILYNLVDVNWNDKEIWLNYKLKCSICEKQFLFNFLSNIDIFIIHLKNADNDIRNSCFLMWIIFSKKQSFHVIKAGFANLFDSSVEYKTKTDFWYDDKVFAIK